MRVFFTKVITVYRLADANDQESYIENGTIKGAIFPLTAESAFLTEGNPADSYKLFTDLASDVKRTDKLTYNEIDYIVTGVEKFDFGATARMEAMLKKFNS